MYRFLLFTYNMCWNQYVSINTFTFGIFVLILIAFNNKYSNYKISEFNNPYTYFFMMSFISMQLFEFILWRNLNNLFINQIISILGTLLLFIQPIASLTMLENIELRNNMIIFYSIPAFIYFFHQVLTKKFSTTISRSGHLKWNWTDNSNLLFTIAKHGFYLFFLYYSLFVNKYYTGIISTSLFFIMFYYLYYRDGSAGSLWCWSVNIVMLYFLVKLLIYLPYQEKYKSK